MDYYRKDGNIYLKRQDFDLAQTLDCGQAFRWSEIAGGYSGTALNKPLTITDSAESADTIVLHDTTEDDFLNFWANYFDLYTDYSELKRRFSEDETLRAACKFAGGIRLLRQNPWEALCSFIISQNNNIPRIKGIISRLCEMCGGFPEPSLLAVKTPDDLAPLRAGFRARYIIDAAQKVSSESISLEEVRKLPLAAAEKKLMEIVGVGIKVADCTLLYGLWRTDAFPVDVWIKRVLAEYYPNGFPAEFDDTRGIAQQYLFHYIRCKEKNLL